MAAVADLLAQDLDVVLTHGNGPQVGNLLVKNEIAAAVVPPVPLDWCGAQTQATLGFVLMNALEAALGRARHRAPYRHRRHPHPRRLQRRRLHPAQQADRPVPAGRGGRPPRRARRDLGGPRREGMAPRRRLARAAPDPRRPGRPGPGRRRLRRGRQRRRRDPGRPRDRRLAPRRRGRHRQGPRRSPARPVGRGRRPRHRHRRAPGRAPLRYAGRRAARHRHRRGSCGRTPRRATSPAARWGPKVDAACRFVEQGGTRSVITSLDQIVDAVAGRAGTVVVPT